MLSIGGSRAVLLLEILATTTKARGEIFDLPSEIATTRRELEGHPLTDRVNLFDLVLAGADLYLLKHILHDWPDSQRLKILSNPFRDPRRRMGKSVRR